jgi:hypothetical protein
MATLVSKPRPWYMSHTGLVAAGLNVVAEG